MPYWEMLGRAVVTLASKSVSEEISEYLTYSGLDGNTDPSARRRRFAASRECTDSVQPL